MTRYREIPPEEVLIKLSEAGEYFGVGAESIRRWVDSGKLIGTRTPGGHRRVFLWSVLKALEENSGRGVRP